MFGQKLCLSVSPSYGLDGKTAVDHIARAGFEAYFDYWRRGGPRSNFENLAVAKDAGLILQSLHAPYDHIADLWHGDREAADAAVAELLTCLEEASELGAPLVILHAFIGFGVPYLPNEQGVENYGKLVRRAGELGLKIALENTEGEVYLAKLLDVFRGEAHVGYCFDSGHEACYNPGQDMLALYGDRLFGTHLNDNLGVKAANGVTSPYDDLHLLPFDGVLDWRKTAARLAKAKTPEILTFEVLKKSKPGRHENDVYTAMPPEIYFAEAYKRACRVATMLIEEKKNA